MILNHKGAPASVVVFRDKGAFVFFCLDYQLYLRHEGLLEPGQVAFDEMIKDWIEEARAWSDSAYTEKLLNRRAGWTTYLAKWVLDTLSVNRYDPGLMTGGNARQF